jgi:hypothetical protein
MNVVLHELVGIALAQEASGRFLLEQTSDRRRTGAWATACALAVGSHVVLDFLPHYYPLTPWEDAVTSLLLVGSWCLLIPPRLRRPLLVVCLAALLPDIVDHVPDDLRKHTGWAVPVVPNLFPCHFTGATSSWPGRSGPKWIVSTVNHLIVLAFCTVALVRTRHLLRLPWRRESPPG